MDKKFYSENILKYYIKNAKFNLLKPKIMKLVYTKKVIFKFNHTLFIISLNKNFNELQVSNDEKMTFNKKFMINCDY
jgi:hypothetical protein